MTATENEERIRISAIWEGIKECAEKKNRFTARGRNGCRVYPKPGIEMTEVEALVFSDDGNLCFGGSVSSPFGAVIVGDGEKYFICEYCTD